MCVVGVINLVAKYPDPVGFRFSLEHVGIPQALRHPCDLMFEWKPA